VGGVCPDEVDVSWDDEGEDLLASPQGFGFKDGWLRHLAVP